MSLLNQSYMILMVMLSYQERDILEDTTSELFDLEISLRIN